MSDKDFFGSEKSMTVSGATKVAIEFVGKEGAVKVLKKPFALQDKEIIDTSVMSKKALIAFFEKKSRMRKRKTCCSHCT